MNTITQSKQGPAPDHAAQMNRRGFLGALGGLATTAFSSFRAEAQSAPTIAVPATPAAPAKTTNFTAQNSVNVSVLYLGQGQLTFRSDNTPITINKNQRDTSQQPVIGPLLAISEGTFVQALSIGLDAIRKNNQGQLPPNASFRLVVTAGNPASTKEFDLKTSIIPAEKDLNRDSISNAATLNQDAYKFFKDTLCVNVAKYGPDHLQSSFALKANKKTPASVYIIMDLPVQQP